MEFHVILRQALLMDLLPVEVGASVTDPDSTSCCRSVPGFTSHLSGRWCRRLLCHSCRSPLCIAGPRVLVVHICSKCELLVFLLLLFLLDVVSFSFSFVVVSFPFAISILSFEWISLSNRLLSVLAFSSFVIVVAVVVPVVPVAFAFVLALLSFSFVVPCCSYVHRCWSLIVAACCDCL